MESGKSQRRIAFKTIDGKPCVAWPLPSQVTPTVPPDEERESAFADFPNISTPLELLDIYERLAYIPVEPFYPQEVEDIDKPETLLDAFGLPCTRKNLNDAKDLLALSQVASPKWTVIPIADCLAMAHDMKALLTVLAFAYGSCGARALSLNTRHDFAFTYEFRGLRSPYGRFLSHVREEDPNELEVDHDVIHENIQKAIRTGNRKPATRILKSMQQFAEHYINGFMWEVHPVLWKGMFTSMSKAFGLSDIYAYWAQRAARGKILACANCGKLVANPRKNQMYCSRSCKVQACKKTN